MLAVPCLLIPDVCRRVTVMFSYISLCILCICIPVFILLQSSGIPFVLRYIFMDSAETCLSYCRFILFTMSIKDKDKLSSKTCFSTLL